MLIVRGSTAQRSGWPARCILIAAFAFVACAYATPAVLASGTQTVKDAAHLHLVGSPGTALSERGNATGTVPGTVHLSFKLNAYTATATFRINSKGSSITGRASGKLKFDKSGYDSFSGKATITHGTGRYAHATGSGNFYGSVYRRTDAMNVQIDGQLRY